MCKCSAKRFCQVKRHTERDIEQLPLKIFYFSEKGAPTILLKLYEFFIRYLE